MTCRYKLKSKPLTVSLFEKIIYVIGCKQSVLARKGGEISYFIVDEIPQFVTVILGSYSKIFK